MNRRAPSLQRRRAVSGALALAGVLATLVPVTASNPYPPLVSFVIGSARAQTQAESEGQTRGTAPIPPRGAALMPKRVADGVWFFEGAREHFTRANGGNIVNTGFIETADGAVVIDSGPSLTYGKAQRAAIREATGRDVRRVYITHAHPDHFLGNQAYEDVPVEALAPTVRTIQRDGESLTQNLYLLVGGAMSGTVPRAPLPLTGLGPGATASAGTSPRLGDTATVEIGGRKLRLIALAGHTAADLAIFDERTRTLFTGDLVFFERTPTTPNADLDVWLAALAQLQALPYEALVPGHGPVVTDGAAIAQTRDYLEWIRDTLSSAAAEGLDMNEVMRARAPERLRRLAVLEEEWHRTVMHLYPGIEEQSLPVTTLR